MTQKFRILLGAIVVSAACSASAALAAENTLPQDQDIYIVNLSEAEPHRALVQLEFAEPISGRALLVPARNGDGQQISGVHCDEGHDAISEDGGWLITNTCSIANWEINLLPIDEAGMDASLPQAGFSERYGFWLVPERVLLRRSSGDGVIRMITRLRDGRKVMREARLPGTEQPPFYGVIGIRPRTTYESDGMILEVYGEEPSYHWMRTIHESVLAQWSSWARALHLPATALRMRWLWLSPPPDSQPGYVGSAGSDALVSQLVMPTEDLEGESKARAIILTGAAHEGFHFIMGLEGKAWPAWVSESLASYFAIEAARRLLPESDIRFVEQYYVAHDDRTPLLEAQLSYTAGNLDAAETFYFRGAQFWRKIEEVLTTSTSDEGRLMALIADHENFQTIDLNDAQEVENLLAQHSGGKATPIVRCYLRGSDCPPE